jgi:hypothetical protein
MNWKTAYRSFYYETAPAPDDLQLAPSETAMLSIDVQNIYLRLRDDPAEHALGAIPAPDSRDRDPRHTLASAGVPRARHRCDPCPHRLSARRRP